MKGNKLLKGWRWTKLKEVATVGAGNPAPQGRQFFENGRHPFIRTQDVGRVHVHSALAETTDHINDEAIEKKRLTLWPEKSLLIPKSGASTFLNHRVLTAVPAYVASHLAIVVARRQVLAEYLFFWSLTLDSRRIAPDNNYPSLRLSDLEQVSLPLPPLPVQERIVEILQKADEIRRKRQEALELADKILPATFHETFEQGEFSWPAKPLKDVVRTRSGGTPSRRKAEYWDGPIPWVSPSDMKVIEIHDSEEHISDQAVSESATNTVDAGTILVVVRSGILAHTFPVAITRTTVAFNQDIRALIPKAELLIPEYLLWALKARAPHVLMSTVKRGSTVHSIDSSRFFDMTIPVPPLPVQRTFVNQVEQLVATSQRLDLFNMDGEGLFSSLLSRAFTGQLTAEWEAANAEAIAARAVLHERMPRLLLLALLAEKAKRASRAAAEVLVTALMKYVFLLQMEGNGGRRLYRFVPYHYGPFAKELYADLEKLQEEGLVTVDNDSEEDKMRIALADPERAEQALAELPDDLKEDAAAIIESYGNLDHNSLLRTVYEKYPAFAKKSRLRGSRKKAGNRKKTTTRRARK